MQPRTVHTDPTRAWEHDARITWDDLAWLRSLTRLPLVLKGILTAEDATRAVECGVDAVIVSNHGGRTLDCVAATADVLPPIADAVAGRMQLLVDGGIRGGADVAKAIALGADAALIGRPVFWGLQLGGADGVRRILEILRGQLDSTMGFLGAPTLAQLTRDRVERRRT
jgi:4-hydroxymandelate oxidase